MLYFNNRFSILFITFNVLKKNDFFGYILLLTSNYYFPRHNTNIQHLLIVVVW